MSKKVNITKKNTKKGIFPQFRSVCDVLTWFLDHTCTFKIDIFTHRQALLTLSKSLIMYFWVGNTMRLVSNQSKHSLMPKSSKNDQSRTFFNMDCQNLASRTYIFDIFASRQAFLTLSKPYIMYFWVGNTMGLVTNQSKHSIMPKSPKKGPKMAIFWNSKSNFENLWNG